MSGQASQGLNQSRFEACEQANSASGPRGLRVLRTVLYLGRK